MDCCHDWDGFFSDAAKDIIKEQSRKLQQEFPTLQNKYWGKHFWAGGYGAWSTGNVTDEMVNNYLEHHRNDPSDQSNFILD